MITFCIILLIPLFCFFIIPVIQQISVNKSKKGTVDSLSFFGPRISDANLFSESKLRDVEVYDSVFTSDSLLELDKSAKLSGDLGHTIFRWRDSAPRTNIESAIKSILESYKDNSSIVEYWWRDEWINVEAHEDIDEKFHSRMNIIRYPNVGHVLYLDVGRRVYGPTVLLFREASHNTTKKDYAPRSYTSIFLCPAVPGRLLRFRGDLTHAVPYPALLYTQPEVTPTVPPEETTPDTSSKPQPKNFGNSLQYMKSFRRSVLLFNTWDGTPPESISHVAPNQAVTAYQQSTKSPIIAKEKEQWVPYTFTTYNSSIVPDTSSLPSTTTCNNNANTNAKNEECTLPSSLTLTIGLMGDYQRRKRESARIDIVVDAAINQSLIDPLKLPAVYQIIKNIDML